MVHKLEMFNFNNTFLDLIRNINFYDNNFKVYISKDKLFISNSDTNIKFSNWTLWKGEIVNGIINWTLILAILKD